MPLKSETHKLRKNRTKGSTDFVNLLSILLGKPFEIVSQSYIPPFSLISSNREIIFELIFKAFDEIFKHPDKYDLPKTDFELSVDGFYDSGKDLPTGILSQNIGSFIFTSS